MPKTSGGGTRKRPPRKKAPPITLIPLAPPTKLVWPKRKRPKGNYA